MVEVLTKLARPDRGGEIFIGRGDDPHVHLLVPGAANAADRPFLDHLQELALERFGQKPDLVEKDRAAVGALKMSGPGLARVGERSTFDAKHDGLKQRAGNRGTIDVLKRAVSPGTGAVDDFGEMALTRPRLALNQDRGQLTSVLLTLEQPSDLLPDRCNSWALPQ